MPRLVTIFDANLYRGLSNDSLTQIRRQEGGAGVLAAPSLLVVTELITHLEHQDDPDYHASRAAIRRLWEHCRIYDGANHFMRFPGSPETMLGQSMFGLRLANQRKVDALLGTTVRAISNSAASRVSGLEREIAHIARSCREVETRFVSSVTGMATAMRRALTRAGGTSIDAAKREEYLRLRREGLGRQLAAEALIRNVADTFDRALTATEVERLGTALCASAAAAFELHDTVLERVILDGMEAPKIANFVWDFYLSLFASPGVTMDAVPLRLVTNDAAIHAACTAVDRSYLAWTLTEYELRLKEGAEALV